jgi:alcohol dehydrogenase YqhD (iron-dependent ADH family)
MKVAAKYRPDRIAPYAERIFGLSPESKTSVALAAEGIDSYVAFLKEIGCPTALSEVEIGDALFEEYATDATLVVRDENGNLLGRPAMTKDDIIEVLHSALKAE